MDSPIHIPICARKGQIKLSSQNWYQSPKYKFIKEKDGDQHPK